jgi:cellulose synthase/poly-beta-1,6-N-acetylglucosamine synthase-like glycosyltransferase
VIAPHGAHEVALAVIHTVEPPIIIFMLALNSFYALLMILSIPQLLRHWRIADDANLRLLRAANVIPPLSILVPAYNEENTIVASVLSYLSLEYPQHEVVVVNDGSTDATLQRLIETYDLIEVPAAYPTVIPTKPVHAFYRSTVHAKLVCVDKMNGQSKGDALNAALNAARYPYVLAVDADTFIERDALLRLARPFLLGERVAAVGATIRISNGSIIEHGRVVGAHVDSRWLPGIQTVEYLRAFLFGRLGWNRLGGGLIVSGAFGLFKQEHLHAIGGYSGGTVTEDLDLVVRLHKFLRGAGSADIVTFVPDPVAWTEAPVTLKVLGAQRERWHRGLIATLVKHKDMMFNPRYGVIGLVAFPFYVLGEMLAPVVEGLGYIVLLVSLMIGAIDYRFAVAFLGVSVGYAFLLSLWAVVLEEISFRRYSTKRDLLKLLWFSLIESFGYRQLTLWFRLCAFPRYLRGDMRWGVMTREGPRGPAHPTTRTAA